MPLSPAGRLIYPLISLQRKRPTFPLNPRLYRLFALRLLIQVQLRMMRLTFLSNRFGEPKPFG
jgi:hypothetical protein